MSVHGTSDLNLEQDAVKVVGQPAFAEPLTPSPRERPESAAQHPPRAPSTTPGAHESPLSEPQSPVREQRCHSPRVTTRGHQRAAYSPQRRPVTEPCGKRWSRRHGDQAWKSVATRENVRRSARERQAHALPSNGPGLQRDREVRWSR